MQMNLYDISQKTSHISGSEILYKDSYSVNIKTALINSAPEHNTVLRISLYGYGQSMALLMGKCNHRYDKFALIDAIERERK